MLALAAGTLVGVALGALSGLAPGIHANTLAAALLATGAGFAAVLGEEALAAAMFAALITHTFLDNIPATFLGVPESDTALASTYVGYAPGQGGTADFAAYPNSASTPLDAQRSYIRIDGPRVWIEFVVQSGVVFRDYVHYHSIWRDKVADYGGQFGSGDTTN